MSSLLNIVRTQFQANGGNVNAVMNQMGMQATRFGQKISSVSSQSSQLNSQWRAIGTTIRYALAGTLTFGALGQVSKLKDLQRQVGLISALSDQTSQTVISNQQLVRDSAIRSITPITEFNEGLINFYSSVQNPPDASQVTKILEDISLTAQLAQTEVPEASKAITGMLNIFRTPPNVSNVRNYTRMLADLITSVPGGAEAGRQIMQQFPVVAAPLAAQGGTPAQTFGLFEALLRSGGTPATHGRGLAFMLQTIGNLSTQPKEVQKAFAGIGVTPDFVGREGIVRALMIAMRAVRAKGVNQRGGLLKSLSDDQLDELGGTAAAQGKNLGISGAGAQLAGELFHRVHALRAFALLSTHPEQVQRDLDSMADDYAGTAESVKKYKADVQKLTDPQKLQKAAIAWQGFQQQIQLAIAPVANLVANQVVTAENFLNRHETGTRRAMVGAIGLGTAYGAARLFGGGRLARIPGIGRLFGGAGSAFIRANAIQAAATGGGGVLGGSPQNPLYVVVVEDLFKGSRSGIIGDTEKVAGGTALFLRKALMRGGRATVGAAETAITRAGAKVGMFGRYGLQSDWEGLALKGAKVGPLGVALTAGGFFADPGNLTNMGDWAANLNTIKKRVPRAYGYENPAFGRFQGHGEVWLDVNYTGPDGKQKTKRVHVPLTEYKGGPAPGNKAKAKGQR